MKKNRSWLFGINQGRAVVYFLCHALIICIGITVIIYSSAGYNRTDNLSENEQGSSDQSNNEQNTSSTRQALLIAVGTGMMATGICGLFTFGWVIYSDNEEEKRKQINAAANFMGLVNAFEKRSIAISDEYLVRVRKARYKIDIMGFGLSALLNDFGNYFEEWAKHAEVRILLIDPDFPDSAHSIASLRDKEERNSDGEIKKDVCNFLKQTQHLWNDKNINFNIKLATVLPSINMFRIDNEIFWGPYFVNSSKNIEKLQSRNLPTFIVDSSGYLFGVLNSHFDAIWTDADKSVEPREELWKK